ncbi:MAG: hypothetical protein QME78_00160 [Thermodesulfobacteriota bacterium]|nr:hypothetical protein [Thermodesulfobacteriota bacterium]
MEAARRHGTWEKLDEREKMSLIAACVKDELFNLPTRRTWWEILTGQ